MNYCIRALDSGSLNSDLTAKIPSALVKEVVGVDLKTGVWPAHLAESLLGALDNYLLENRINKEWLIYQLINDAAGVIHHALLMGYRVEVANS